MKEFHEKEINEFKSQKRINMFRDYKVDVSEGDEYVFEFGGLKASKISDEKPADDDDSNADVGCGKRKKDEAASARDNKRKLPIRQSATVVDDGMPKS